MLTKLRLFFNVRCFQQQQIFENQNFNNIVILYRVMIIAVCSSRPDTVQLRTSTYVHCVVRFLRDERSGEQVSCVQLRLHDLIERFLVSARVWRSQLRASAFLPSLCIWVFDGVLLYLYELTPRAARFRAAPSPHSGEDFKTNLRHGLSDRHTCRHALGGLLPEYIEE